MFPGSDYMAMSPGHIQGHVPGTCPGYIFRDMSWGHVLGTCPGDTGTGDMAISALENRQIFISFVGQKLNFYFIFT